MARRKVDPSKQIGFDLPVSIPPPVAPKSTEDLSGTPVTIQASPVVEAVRSEPVSFADDLDELDDYIEDDHKLRLVDPPRPSPRVIVEAVGNSFEVSRLRDNGSTVACVIWSRSELEELRARIDAALEM